MTVTNAQCKALAATIASGNLGTFSGYIGRKQGNVKGRGKAKKLYGDDLVHVVMVTGIKYPKLKERDAAILASLTPAGLFAEATKKNLLDGNGNPVTEMDFGMALAEMRASAEKSANGTNTATHDHVYEPLVVDGKVVRGCNVYKCVASDPNHDCHCRDCTGDAKAPLAGTIYLAGIKVGETVLEAAKNGPVPPAKSAAKTVAKGWIRGKLPSRRYIRYRLDPQSDFILRVGGAAAVAADKDGVELKDKAVADMLQAA